MYATYVPGSAVSLKIGLHPHVFTLPLRQDDLRPSFIQSLEPLSYPEDMAVTSEEKVVANSSDDRDMSISPTSDYDETYEIYRKQDATDIDPEEAKRVLRKIDLRILPLLMVTYMLQYLDKSSISFASVYGLQTGTNLVGQQYAWLSSIFYFGAFCELIISSSVVDARVHGH